MEPIEVEESPVGTAPLTDRIRAGLRGVVQPFIDLARAPRALWGINVTYFLEGFVYFGIANYLTIYFSQYVFAAVDKPDMPAHWMTSTMTGGITIAMFFLGPVADRWGPRASTIVAFLLMGVGRAILAAAPGSGLAPAGPIAPMNFWSLPAAFIAPMNLLALGGILIVVTGYGLYQPAAYLGVRQFTTKKTAPMAYGMLYALMNFGGWLPTFVAPVRQRWDIAGALWLYVAFTGLSLILTVMILTRRTEKRAIEAARLERLRNNETTGESPKSAHGRAADEAALPFSQRAMRWLRQHPLANGRFTFFIFALIPVQTLFAYNYYVLPQYVRRAYRGSFVGEYYEVATNFNPILIFILVPVVTALTSHKRVYTMMIWGTLVMALPTFLLAFGAHWWTLFPYLIVMSIGEAMWQPRFLQYAAEIAPEGRTGAYMGVAQFPWFLTKVLVPVYTSWMMPHYCPEEGELRTEQMWLIFACVAMMSTVLLVLAKNWVGRGFKERAA